MTRILPNSELTRAQDNAAEDMRKTLRAKLIEADGDARPPFFWKLLAVRLGEDGEAEERAQRRVEVAFRAVTALVLLYAVTVFAIDAIRRSEKASEISIMYGHEVLGGFLCALSFACLVLVLIDLATYKPRLFTGCAESSADDFFRELAPLSTDLEDQVETIEGAAIVSWREHSKHVEDLLAESQDGLLLDGLRRSITYRMVGRLAALIASLALLGYNLSAALHSDVIAASGISHAIGFPEHLYFAATTFFTIGYGDIHPTRAPVSGLYLFVIIATFVLVVYFVLTDIIASHGEFRTNIRTAAVTFVMKRSAF